MRKVLLFISLALVFVNSFGQSKIEWSDTLKLKVEDFQATAPNTGTRQTVYANTSIEYKYMNFELLFSSNFNKNVTCYFYRAASWFDKGKSTDKLLRYAQTVFDLHEWETRELRKKFRENKSEFLAGKSNEIYEKLDKEFAEIQSKYSKETDFGSIEEKQVEWGNRIKNKLAELADYCKNCIPVKKKK
jgi:hypothetical protein